MEDLGRAKALYSTLLGVGPYVDEAYSVGFRVGDQEVGLGSGPQQGMAAPVGYCHVDDINTRLQQLLDSGAAAQDAIRDVGGGQLVAAVKEADGSITGLVKSA